MATLLSQLDIDKAQIDAIKPEGVSEGFLLPSGMYDAAIDEAYIRKTDSGAKMLEVKFILADESGFSWSTCVLSGDEKGNKSTYTTKQNKEVNLPGVVQMQHFFDAIGVPNPSASQGEVMHRDEKIKALCIEGVQGKKLKLGVNQQENLYNGDVTVRNDVKYWLTENGENSKGEDLLEKAVEALQKNPIKKLKNTPAFNTPAQTGGTNVAEAAAEGW